MFSPLKIIFFITDTLLLFLGIVVLAVGVWIVADRRFSPSHIGITAAYWFHKSSYLIIAFGFVLVFFASIGLCALIAQSIFLLLCFSICCILPLLLVLVALGFVCYLLSSTVSKTIVEEQLRSYWVSRETISIFKNIEMSLMCCGIRGPSDYNNSVPDSCIDEESTMLRRMKTTVTEREYNATTETYTTVTHLMTDHPSNATLTTNINATLTTIGHDNGTLITHKDANGTLTSIGHGDLILSAYLLHNKSSKLSKHISLVEVLDMNTSHDTRFNSSENSYKSMSKVLNNNVNRYGMNKLTNYSLRRSLQIDNIATKMVDPADNVTQRVTTSDDEIVVYYEKGCLDRLKEMILTVTGVLSGLYATILILMVISFIIALVLRKRSEFKMEEDE